MTETQALEIAETEGFSHIGKLRMTALHFLPEVRQMCKTGKCGGYGKYWTCPPYCGPLEEIKLKANAFTKGILVQTTGQMEDDFDVECMLETERLHKQHFNSLVAKIRRIEPDCLPMGTGVCGICKSCTCPNDPCRHPDLAISSMEAYGLLVSDVCKESGLGYYYGLRSITYTACVLLK